MTTMVPLRNPLRCAPLLFFIVTILTVALIGSIGESIKITISGDGVWILFLMGLVVYLLCCMGYDIVAWIFAVIPYVLFFAVIVTAYFHKFN